MCIACYIPVDMCELPSWLFLMDNNILAGMASIDQMNLTQLYCSMYQRGKLKHQ